MLQLRSTAKVLNQQSKWGRVLSPHKVFTNLLPRLLWISRFQYLRCIFARVIVCAEYWLTCVYVRVLTWTGVHRAPLYTQAALPKWARIHRPPKQHFHPGPESSAACTEKTATVFWSYLLILTWPSRLVSNEPINKGIKGASYHTRLKCQSFSSLYPHLNDIMHVWQETVQADFQQHDESSAHVLSHFWLLVCRQSKQVLQRVETGGQKGWIFSSHQLQWVKHDGASQKRGKLTGLLFICLYNHPKRHIKPN